MKLKDFDTNMTKESSSKKYYLVYCRKSSESEDRQMESIPAQMGILNDLCKQKNLPILKFFKESKSAKVPGRPKFNEMVKEIDSRDDIKGILCWKINRLFRNPEDEGKIRQRLSDGRVEEIVTPSKTYYEADSDFIMAVEGAQAQRFIRDLREDTKRGIDRKLDKGQAPIFAPVGYKNNIHKRQGDKDISTHPLYFSLVRKVFELAMTGNFSLEELAEKSRNMGIKNNRGKYVSRSQMADILRSPFYTGKFLYAGRLYQGKHKPMITEDEYDLLQEIMSGKSRPRKEKHNFPLTGLIRCGECGMMITAESHTKHYKNGKSQIFIYYRCTKKGRKECNQPYLPAPKLEAQVIDFLKAINMSDSFVNWAVKWLNKTNEDHQKVRKNRLESLQKDYKNIRISLDNLLELKISPKNTDGNLLSDEEFQEQRAKLIRKKSKIKSLLKKDDKQADEWIDLTAKTFDFAAKAQERFTNGSSEDKKTILKAVGSNLFLKNKELTIQPRKPFLLIKEAVSKVKSSDKRLEPIEVPEHTPKYEQFYAHHLVWGD